LLQVGSRSGFFPQAGSGQNGPDPPTLITTKAKGTDPYREHGLILLLQIPELLPHLLHLHPQFLALREPHVLLRPWEGIPLFEDIINPKIGCYQYKQAAHMFRGVEDTHNNYMS
jgi:hypothetical protein